MLDEDDKCNVVKMAPNIGALKPHITLELHTHQATRLWAGRRADASENRQGVIGLIGYLHLTNIIKTAAIQDDPYADWMMIQIEERIEKAKIKLSEIRKQAGDILESIPKQLTVTENRNTNPATMHLFVNSPLGFQGVYLLVEFDELAKDLYLVNHMGLMSRHRMMGLLNQASHQVRGAFAIAQGYRNTGVTRSDITANNECARGAIEKFGLPPQDILEGRRRSSFAPTVRKKSEETPLERETSVDIEQETEIADVGQ